MRICQHCKEHPVSRPKRLCWVCYYDPQINKLYQSTSIKARRSPAASASRSRLPEPDLTLEPGSEEKIEVMAKRAIRGESLFHPLEKVVVRDDVVPFQVPTVTFTTSNRKFEEAKGN